MEAGGLVQHYRTSSFFPEGDQFDRFDAYELTSYQTNEIHHGTKKIWGRKGQNMNRKDSTDLENLLDKREQ